MWHVRLCWYHTESAQLHIEREGSPRRREGWGWGGGGKRKCEEGSLWSETFHDLESVVPWPRSFLHPPSVKSGAHVWGSALSFSLIKTHPCARARLAAGERACAWRLTRGRRSSGVPRSSRAPRGGITGSARSITSDAPRWIDGAGRGCSRCSLPWLTPPGQVGGRTSIAFKIYTLYRSDARFQEQIKPK